MIYTLVWNYGVHHVHLNVSESDFNRVIDDLSKEFEINTRIVNGNSKEYSLIDYLGHKYVIGYIFY